MTEAEITSEVGLIQLSYINHENLDCRFLIASRMRLTT